MRQIKYFQYLTIILVCLFIVGGCKKSGQSSLSKIYEKIEDFAEKNLRGVHGDFLKWDKEISYKYKIVASSQVKGCTSVVYPEGTSDNIYMFDAFILQEGDLSVVAGPPTFEGAQIDFVKELNFKDECFPYTLKMALLKSNNTEAEYADLKPEDWILYSGQIELKEPPSNSEKTLQLDLELSKIDLSNRVEPAKKTITFKELISSECWPLTLTEAPGPDQYGPDETSDFTCENGNNDANCRVFMLPESCKSKLNIIKKGYPVGLTYLTHPGNKKEYPTNQTDLQYRFPNLWDRGEKGSFIFGIGLWFSNPKYSYFSPYWGDKLYVSKEKIEEFQKLFDLSDNLTFLRAQYLIDKKDFWRTAKITFNNGLN